MFLFGPIGPIFVADTKIIYGYNFVAPLTFNQVDQKLILFCSRVRVKVLPLKRKILFLTYKIQV